MSFRLVLCLMIVRGCEGTSERRLLSGRSPALAWQSVEGKNPLAQAGLEVIKKIAADHVIDDFMEKYPEFKAILWGEPHDRHATLMLAVEYAQKNVCQNTELDAYMTSRGFVPATSTYKKNEMFVNHNTGEKLFAKDSHAPRPPMDGPGNGYLRAFYQDVFMKLRQFNSNYGWDNGLTACLYSGKRLIMVGLYNPDVTLEQTPRTWVLPQLHYMGVLPLDLHHGNFAIVKGEPSAVPVDLDATRRGELSSFMKMNPDNLNIDKMEHNYHSIDHILDFAATEDTQNGILSSSVVWSFALGGFLGSSLVIAASKFKKKGHAECAQPLLA